MEEFSTTIQVTNGSYFPTHFAQSCFHLIENRQDINHAQFPIDVTRAAAADKFNPQNEPL